MNEIAYVILENEMDLILVHRLSMRLAELGGLSLAAQTTFATAVSEVSRSAAGKTGDSCLTLYVSDKREKFKYITAILKHNRIGQAEVSDDDLKYAKKLVQTIRSYSDEGGNKIELKFRLPNTVILDDATIEKWRASLNTNPAISPYEEIKRKNRQLTEMADRLRESELQYKMLTDSLPIMILSISNDGNIIYGNQWTYDYTGETLESINQSGWANIVHPEDSGVIKETWAHAGSKLDVINFEHRINDSSNGEYRWHTGVAIAIKDENGANKYWNTFMVDIHAQKIIEKTLKDNKQLRDTQAELEDKVNLLNRSNEQLEQFAYITSHDLQEPLRKISFYSDYLSKKHSDSIPAEAKIFLENLIKASSRMRNLIQDVLAYSVVRKDVFTDVDLNELAQETVHDLEIGIRDKSAIVYFEPLPVIEGNKRQLKQLFENIVSNSLKFSRPDTHPVISISAEDRKEHILLSFKDNGIGFDEAYIDKMFDLFQRLHTKDKYSGTGIGLAICKKIVDLHKGSIEARSQPGEGASFTFTLPKKQEVTKL